MTEKIIIENRAWFEMRLALELAADVVAQGRISNNNTQYCYGTRFTVDDKSVMVAAFKNKKSDRLVIYEEPWIEENE